MSGTEHVFSESLSWAQEQEAAPWWAEVYGDFFRDYSHHTHILSDGWAQRAGVDHVITLKSGKVWAVDVKARDAVKGKVYRDCLLEFISNDKKQTPGWVVKDLAADFIAYAIVPLRKVWLLSVPQLQRAWVTCSAEWTRPENIRKSPNNGYNTLNAPVDWRVLMEAMWMAGYTRWSEPQDQEQDDLPF